MYTTSSPEVQSPASRLAASVEDGREGQPGQETYGGLFQDPPALYDVVLTNPPFGGKEGKDAQTRLRRSARGIDRATRRAYRLRTPAPQADG